LQRMGQIAAQCVLEQIEGLAEYVPEIAIEPELVVRASSGPVASPFASERLTDVDSISHD